MKTKNIVIAVIAFLASMGIVIAVGLLLFGGNNIDKQIQEQLRLGQRYLSEMKYEEAIVAFRKVIELDPKNTEAYVSLADAYAENGQLEEALEVLENAPDDVDDPDAIEEKLEEIQQLAEEQERENAENETTAAEIETDSGENVITEEEITTAAAESEMFITPDEATAIWEDFFISGDYLTYSQEGAGFTFTKNGELEAPLEYVITDVNADTIPELLVRQLPGYIDKLNAWVFVLDNTNIHWTTHLVGYLYGNADPYWYSPGRNAIITPFFTDDELSRAVFKHLDDESLEMESMFAIGNRGGQCYYDESADGDDKIIISDDEYFAYFDDVIKFQWKPVASLTGETVETTAAAADTTRPAFVPWAEAGLEDHVMDWKDSVLEARMREITGIYDRDIMLSDVWEITELDLNLYERSDRIKTIDALVELTNLTYLALMDNQIKDITPLSNLTSLTVLHLGYNQINDITPLSNLTSLTSLTLLNNQISDITPLSNLTSLTELYLSDNQISNIAALSNLTSLLRLNLSDNQISDVIPLSNMTSLTYLRLVKNQITNVTSLSNLASLTELYLSINQISDIIPLSNLTSLTILDLGDNQISDITPLSNLTSLTDLDLGRNQISDITPLSNLTSLRLLWLSENPITDYTSVNFVPYLVH